MATFKLSENVAANKIFLVQLSELEGRLDASVYKNSFNFKTNSYPVLKLSEIAYVNPLTSFSKLENDNEISFIPMEAIDEKVGTITKHYTKRVTDTTGFTRFKENDLIWAKITPCMQNGKSAIVTNTLNGYACGSTEFFIIRPKNDEILVQYLHYLLRDKRVLNNAQNYFGGSAGQQRVSKEFLLDFQVPVPPLSVQKKITSIISDTSSKKEKKEVEAKVLLDGINDYLLEKLGINLPIQTSNHEKTFLTTFSSVTGTRLDPKLYDKKTFELRNAITNASYGKLPLHKLITQSIAGNWGMEDTDEPSQDFERCLVIRATEFDNQGNLKLDNSRVKFRLLSSLQLKKMDIQPNDLLIEKSGGSVDQPVGRIAILTDILVQNNKLAYSNFIQKIRVDTSQVLPLYLFYFLKMLYSIKLTDAMQSQTNGIRNLIMSNYFKQEIVLPPISTQKEITNHIEKIKTKAHQLQSEAEDIIKKARLAIEKTILN